MTPEDFPKRFAAAFATQDSAAISDFLAGDAVVVTLTGIAAEGRDAAGAALAAEFAGIFAAARLVTGKLKLRPLGPGGMVLHQRFVVTGARDAEGQDMPRFGAMLSAVLLARPDGWRAESLTLSALA